METKRILGLERENDNSRDIRKKKRVIEFDTQATV